DTRSRQQSLETDRTLAVLKQLADLRVRVGTAESAARDYALTGDPGVAEEYRQTRDALAPDFAALIAAINDPVHRRL
ncbi:CHASE3 domain-containing protein, partial [Acinetobacter baumannii]